MIGQAKLIKINKFPDPECLDDGRLTALNPLELSLTQLFYNSGYGSGLSSVSGFGFTSGFTSGSGATAVGSGEMTGLASGETT